VTGDSTVKPPSWNDVPAETSESPSRSYLTTEKQFVNYKGEERIVTAEFHWTRGPSRSIIIERPMPVFISHHKEDKAEYTEFCQLLDAESVQRWDVAAMRAGASLREQLRQAIQGCEVCVFLATPGALKSDWCQAELGAFWGAGKRVICFVQDEAVVQSDLPPQFQADLCARDPRRVIQAVQSELRRLEAEESALRRSQRRRRWLRLGILPVTALIVAGSVALVSTPAAPVSFDIAPPTHMTFASEAASVPGTQLALSPDGTRLAFVAAPTPGCGNPTPRIFISELRKSDPQRATHEIKWTEGASYPFWSPDGQSIAFFAKSKLCTIDTASDAQQEPDCRWDAPLGRGGAWGESDILFSSGVAKAPLLRVSTRIGDDKRTKEATKVETSQVWHRWPQFISKDSFIYFVRNENGSGGIHFASLGSGPQAGKEIVKSNFAAAYAHSGYLFYLDEYQLVARPFDPLTKILGEVEKLPWPVGFSSVQYASFSVSSRDKRLAFATGQVAQSRLTVFDRNGEFIGEALRPNQAGEFLSFRRSPDGHSLAVSRVQRPHGAPELAILRISVIVNAAIGTS
jgi:hypothetical protein